MDARFNKRKIIEKIERIACFRESIILENQSVFDLANNFPSYFTEENGVLVFLDPPYVVKGKALYPKNFSKQDHRRLRYAVENISSNWIMTYDNHDLIKNLYSNQTMIEYYLNYSVSSNRTNAKELMIFSKDVRVSEETLSKLVTDCNDCK